MAMSNVMVADGGGGKDYGGQYVPIKDVVGDNKLTEEELINKYKDYILYETEIDTADLKERIDTLKEKVLKTAEQLGANIDNIQKEQKKTGSNTVDDENNNNTMADIFGTVSTLTTTLGLSCMENFGSNLSHMGVAACNVQDSIAIAYLNDMIEKCQEYNNVIKKLKKGLKLKLLQAKADEINERSLVRERPDPTTISVPSDQWLYDYSYNSDGIWKYKIHYSFKEISKDGMSNIFIQTIEKHEYINYWGWIKSSWKPFTIFDDDIDELAGKLKALGYTLPYNESKIRGEVD